MSLAKTIRKVLICKIALWSTHDTTVNSRLLHTQLLHKTRLLHNKVMTKFKFMYIVKKLRLLHKPQLLHKKGADGKCAIIES